MHKKLPSISIDRVSQRGIPLLISLTVHTALLLILATWLIRSGLPNKSLTIIAATAEASDALLEICPSSSVALQSDVIEPTQPIAQTDTTSVKFQFSATDFVPDKSAVDEQSSLSASLVSASLAAVTRDLDTKGLGRGATFFGTYANGGRFVFVLDSSSSMKGDRWNLARRKLIECLQGLSREQEFFVICFDEQSWLMFNSSPDRMKFQPPSELVIERTNRWLRSRILGAATMPSQSLQFALSLQPDAIFLLSDGELQDDTLNMLRYTNIENSWHKQIPIHAIHLLSQHGYETLRTLANENGGTFRHIER